MRCKCAKISKIKNQESDRKEYKTKHPREMLTDEARIRVHTKKKVEGEELNETRKFTDTLERRFVGSEEGTVLSYKSYTQIGNLRRRPSIRTQGLHQ